MEKKKECRGCQLLEGLIDAFVSYKVYVDSRGQPRGLVFLDLNPAFEKMVGARKSDLKVGNIITKLPAGLHRFDFDWLGTHARLPEVGKSFRLEHYSAPLNRWYEVAICQDKQGCFAAIFRDISIRRQAENAQRKSFYLLKALLDNIPGCFAVILKKHSRKIIASNRAAKEIGALPGQNCFKIIGKRDNPCPFCQASKLWDSGKTQYIKVKYRGRWYEGIWAPLSDDLYVHYIIDINKYMLAEQKITAYTLELEQLYHQLEEEMEKVKEIHRRTFPSRIPPVKGCSLAAHYQPARRLGGDFYDIVKVDQKLVLYLSDVSGHGPEGALLSTFVKEAINSYICLKPDEICPGKILHHLHQQYRQQNYPENYFICIFLAVFDLFALELSYIGAGFQTFPLVQMGNGLRLQLSSEGLPISNAIPGTLMNFTTKQITLLPGTTIFFNTDGLIEQEAGGTYYGARFHDIFFKKSHLPPEAIVQAISEDFRKFNAGCLQGDDDITFVVLQVDR